MLQVKEKRWFEMCPRTTNERYKKFLDNQIVEPIDKTQFKEMLEQVEHPKLKEARALCILLWTTAARPIEALQLNRDDIHKKDYSVWINLPGSKGSLARTIELPVRNDMVKELWHYVSHIFAGLDVFPTFYSATHRDRIQKRTKKGELKYYYGEKGKGYQLYSSNLIYWFKKWFDLPPYIFRHNRMTIAAEKLNKKQLMQLKGAKTEASVWVYVGLTKKEAKKIGRELVK